MTLNNSGNNFPGDFSHLHIWGMGKIADATGNRFFNSQNSSSNELGRYANIDTANVGDVVEYEFALNAGIYTLVTYSQRQSDRGIAGFYLDNKYIGKIDLYSASAINRIGQNLDFAITNSGQHTFKIVTVGKNSSSTGYFLSFSCFYIRSRAISVVTPAQTVRINCGATTDYTDPQGNLWVPSFYQSGGTNWDIEQYTGTYTVTNTDKPTLYKTETSLEPGTFSYKIPIFNPGIHTLNLHFSENNKTAAGQRVGTVALNGSNILSNFDIFAETGAQHKALIKTFSNQNLSSTLTLTITNTLINGIELIKL